MARPVVGLALASFAAFSLAVQSLAVRRATRTQSVAALTGTVFAVNVFLLVPVTAVRHAPDYGLTARSVLAFAAGGALGSLLARVALFVGISRLGASRAEPLKSTFPLVSVAAAVLVLGDRLTVPLLAGVTLLVAGAVAVSWDARKSGVAASGRQAWVDLAFPLAAAVLLGIDPVFTKTGLEEGTPALVGVTVRVLAAASGFAGYLLWRRARRRGTGLTRPTRWAVAAGLANTAYLGSYLAALSRAPVSVVAPILGASPLLVVLGSALFAREEEVTARLGVAVAVLVAGVVLIVRG
ncbi:DMT family transporter [Haloarcula nitratireducens]|uniref:DMT family transporter n=1 Tax=Haloarcula nitratireducens TaxID=2487749 RepID=A0AAW4PCY8_9EURY|nr:EamA family transporter [Halomicroarcula nitratireducens]MBX0295540.1 DMT family transporter [Halomicroarcula nitratireducens]